MSRYKRYEKYKDSGVEWIGEIPEHWIHCKLGYLLVKNDSGTWGDDYDDDGVVVLRSTEITLNGTWSIVDPARRMIPVKEYERCLLREGDLILTKSSGSEQHIGKTVIVDEDIAKMKCVFSNFMQRLRPENGKLLPKYLYYFLNVNGREQLFYLSTTTTGLKNISGSTINALKIQLPTMYEQVIIANFLDQKTAEIDALIADKEKLIELLQEKRQAIITEAVTKGLDPNVKMKDSGIEWIGEIPEHWEILKVSWIFNIIGSGTTPFTSNIDYYDGDIPWVNTGDLNDNYLYETSKNITDLAVHECSALKFYPIDTLLIAMYGATIGKLAITKIVVTTNQACCALAHPKNGSTKFIFYWFLANRDHIIAMAYGGGQPNISQNLIKSLRINMPGKHEQDSIVYYLDQKTAEIDALIADIDTQIQKLKEYRQSLISEAVTGKIDVRDYVID